MSLRTLVESLRKTYVGRKVEETITHRSQPDNLALEKKKEDEK